MAESRLVIMVMLVCVGAGEVGEGCRQLYSRNVVLGVVWLLCRLGKNVDVLFIILLLLVSLTHTVVVFAVFAAVFCGRGERRQGRGGCGGGSLCRGICGGDGTALGARGL